MPTPDVTPTPEPTSTPISISTPDTTSDPSDIKAATAAPAALSHPSSEFTESNILPEGTKRARISSRKAVYTVALEKTSKLTPYHAAFVTGQERGENTSKKKEIHRDTLPTEPQTWRQMLKHKFSTEFTQAASREIQILERKGTFQYVPRRSAKTTPLPLLWVFKYKFDSNGYLIKFKARLCVRGDLQTTEQDTYAATLAARTFRAFTAIAAAFDLDIHQYDAISAFLNSRLSEEIFCYTPEGFEKAGYVWLLLRALYGLRQAPLLWYQEFTTALEQLSL
jgi:Reverse transcriptase (RNA-dependent DNA polymerase)